MCDCSCSFQGVFKGQPLSEPQFCSSTKWEQPPQRSPPLPLEMANYSFFFSTLIPKFIGGITDVAGSLHIQTLSQESSVHRNKGTELCFPELPAGGIFLLAEL